MSKYNYQIKHRLQYHWMRLRGKNEYPRPCWRYPTDGWITNPKEIINAIRLEDKLGIKTEREL